MSLKARIERLEAILPRPAKWAVRLLLPDGGVRWRIPIGHGMTREAEGPPPGVPVVEHQVEPRAHTHVLADADGSPRIVTVRIEPRPPATPPPA